MSIVFSQHICSTNFFRATNILFGIGSYQILWKLMIKFHPFQNRDLLSFNALILSLFPVGWFFNFLYYTDSGSTFFVLWSYLLSTEKKYWMSAMVKYYILILFQFAFVLDFKQFFFLLFRLEV